MKAFAPLLVDGYKTGHKDQYPSNATLVFSNMTPRGSRIENVDKVVFFGLQYFLQKYVIENWNESFFSQPVDVAVKRYTRLLNAYLGPNSIGDQHLRDLHALGYLPLSFWALPEGSRVPLRVPMYVVYNTHPNFAWLTNAIETIASASIWLPTTSATIAREYRELLGSWATMTNPEMIEFVPWQGHDFSFRGHTSFESAMLSGSGHMLSFFGTDTVPALEFLETYYQADLDKEIVGGSVAATEHSVMCMGGMDDEVETFRRLIEDVYPTGIVSIVSDTWDFWSVVDPENGICVKLKDKIMAREGKVVIRPDSGDPVKIVTGYMEEEISIAADGSYYDRETLLPLTANEVKGMIQCLYEIFGGTETTTGYIQLDSHIGAIYGDSITLQRASDICSRLERKGFASTNLVYGIGSYTYQYVTRDTFGFAVKSTYGEVRDPDGKIEGIEIFKDPKTDDGLKKSAKGLTAVYASEKGDFYMKDQATWDDVTNCAFVNVFADGILKQRWSLAEVRATLNS